MEQNLLLYTERVISTLQLIRVLRGHSRQAQESVIGYRLHHLLMGLGWLRRSVVVTSILQPTLGLIGQLEQMGEFVVGAISLLLRTALNLRRW